MLTVRLQLESALAADAQRRSLESHLSESDMSESTRSRRRAGKTSRTYGKHSRGASKRSFSASSPPQATPAEPRPVNEASQDKKSESAESKRPTEHSINKQSLELPTLRTSSSSVSNATISTTPRSAITPTTPSLSIGTSVTTDDEDTDFQSAYSTSPRGSYGSLGEVKTHNSSDSEQGTPTASEKFPIEAIEALRSPEPKGRERGSSTSTVGRGIRSEGMRNNVENVITARPTVLSSS